VTDQKLTEQANAPIDMGNLRPMATSNKVGFEAAPSWPLSERARNLRILLLEPLFPPSAAWGSAKHEQGYLPPIGTISVYGWLKHRGYDVSFLDTQFQDVTQESLTATLREGGFDVVAMPVFTPTADYVYATARLVREVLPKARIVLGGVHVTSLPEPSMDQCPECDFIIRHEAEYSFDELLSALADGNDWSNILGLVYRAPSGKVVVNPQRAFIGDLNTLPVGFYSDLDLSRYVPHATQYLRLPNYPLMTQRGCPYFCSYCEASIILGKKARFYTPQRIIEELKILIHEKGARGIYFQDSTFTIRKGWTMELMELMIKEKLDLLWSCNTRADRVDPELLEAMYKAGGRQIVLGIESGNQQSLDLIQKGTTVEKQTQGVKWIREAGFRYLCSFIICLPGETEEMVLNTINYAKSLRAHTAMFYLPVPYPGSELFRACRDTGGVRRVANWSDFIAIDFDNPVYVNPQFGIEGMRYWYKRAYMEYYRSPAIWWENLRTIRTAEDVNRLVRGGRALGMMLTHNLTSFMKSAYRGYHGQGAPTEGA
jgi:radical SAM superfamily enzyme YgiQ (UPF0313 family)